LRGVMASQLYGVGALDPVVTLIATVVLIVAAFVAAVVPARRAARVDPVIALGQ
jgi:ABC-type antimicrobial peptide transport system permease subunit